MIIATFLNFIFWDIQCLYPTLLTDVTDFPFVALYASIRRAVDFDLNYIESEPKPAHSSSFTTIAPLQFLPTISSTGGVYHHQTSQFEKLFV